jgi:hypothetical protein
MTWVKIADEFYRNPKMRAAGKNGRALYLAGLCYCASGLTDGHVAAIALPVLAAEAEVPGKATAAKLVDIGAWVPVNDGWCIPDYLDYNPTREQVQAERDAAKERQRRARDKASESRRMSRRDIGRTSPESHAVSAPVSHGPPVPSRPVPSVDVDPSVVSSLAKGTAGRDDRVTTAIRIGAQRDLDRQLAAGRVIRNNAAYLAQCIADRHDQDGPALDALAANWPEADPQQLLDKIDNDRKADGYLG